MSKERFENKLLRFSDDPMFRRVMRDEEIAKGVAGTILGKKIDAVSYVNTEQEMALRDASFGEGKAEGIAEGEARYRKRQTALMEAMEAAGRTGEFVKALKDCGEMDRLMEEYGID